MSSMNKYKIPTLEDIKKIPQQFEFISLFAGGGGSSTGYRMAGGNCLVANEFVPEAAKTYRTNYPDTVVIERDIRSITPEDLLKASGKNKYELDLLDGSPPCSAFSTLGAKEKGWGKTKKYSDTKQKNVEDLFYEYVRMVEGIMPRVFIAENVAGLTKGKAKGYLNDILRRLKALDYRVEARLMNAKNLGVPQSRTRLIIIGARDDLLCADTAQDLHPRPIDGYVAMRQAFEGLTATDNDLKETCIKKYKVYQLLKTLKIGEQHKKAFSLIRCDPNNVSPCITATNSNLGAREVRHWDLRAFTINELKRLMSLPDDYMLTGTYQQQAERIGRMVAPFVYRAVGEHLIKIGAFK